MTIGFVCCVANASSLRADQIIIGDRSVTNVALQGFDGGKLRFRLGDGRIESVWFEKIDRIVVDRGGLFADFNEAERFRAAGEAARAVVRYGRALRLSDRFWRDLLLARLTQSCETAGDVEKTVTYFVQLVRRPAVGVALASRIMPRTVPTEPGGRTRRAITQLDAAIVGAADPAHKSILKILRFDLLRRSEDGRALAAAANACGLSIPSVATGDPPFRIQLDACRMALEDEVSVSALVSLDRAIQRCPESVLPSFLLLKGRTLLRTAVTREEVIRATWPLMRVAIHFPHDARAAEALLASSRALERIGRDDKAADLLRECIALPVTTDSCRRDAESALARLTNDASGRSEP